MQHAQQLETFIITYDGKAAFWEIIRLAQELDDQVTLAAGGDITIPLAGLKQGIPPD